MTTLPLFEREKPIMSEMKLSDLRRDNANRNANLGSARGQQMIETSLQKYGAGRSIVLDRNNRIILQEIIQQRRQLTVGLDDNVVVVQSDGKSIGRCSANGSFCR